MVNLLVCFCISCKRKSAAKSKTSNTTITLPNIILDQKMNAIYMQIKERWKGDKRAETGERDGEGYYA